MEKEVLKKSFKYIYCIFIITAIFVAGLFVGQKYINFKPQKAQALQDITNATKIHNLKFRALVYKYLLTHKVPGKRYPQKMYTILPSKVEELMTQLDNDGYFTRKNTKQDRWQYLTSLYGQPNKHYGVLYQHLWGGFDKDTNYEYYTGNISNKDNHSMWDWAYYHVLSNNDLFSSIIVGPAIEGQKLKGYTTIRSIAFDFTEVNQTLYNRVRVKYYKDPGAIMAHLTDNDLIPRLRDKKELTPTSLDRLYNLPLFMNFKDLGWKDQYYTGSDGWGGWRPGEIAIFEEALQLDKDLVRAAEQMPVDDYEKAIKVAQDWKNALVSAVGATNTIKVGGSGLGSMGRKIGGLGLSKIAKKTTYRWPVSGSVIDLSSAQLRFMTTRLSSSGVSGLPSSLRGQSLNRAIGVTINDFDKIETKFQRPIFDNYTVRIVRELKVGKNSVSGFQSSADLRIGLDENGAFLNPYGWMTRVHEGLHVAKGYGDPVGEALIEYFTRRLGKSWGYPIPNTWSTGYRASEGGAAMMNSLARANGASIAWADQAMENFFIKDTLQAPYNLDLLFGTGFYNRMLPYFDNVTNLQTQLFNLKLRGLKADNPIFIRKTNEYNRSIKNLIDQINSWPTPRQPR